MGDGIQLKKVKVTKKCHFKYGMYLLGHKSMVCIFFAPWNVKY